MCLKDIWLCKLSDNDCINDDHDGNDNDNKIKWNRFKDVKLPLGLSRHSCVIDKNAKYVVITNGNNYQTKLKSNTIYILDFAITIWKKSKILLPHSPEEFISGT